MLQANFRMVTERVTGMTETLQMDWHTRPRPCQGPHPIPLPSGLLRVHEICPEIFRNPKSGIHAECPENPDPPGLGRKTGMLPHHTVSCPPATVYAAVYQPLNVPFQTRASAKLLTLKAIAGQGPF